MVLPSSVLALSPAQRALAEKGLAARQTRTESDAIQRAVEAAAKAHADEAKARIRAPAIDTKNDRERRMIIRHVGEELARVAKRDVGVRKLKPAKAKAAAVATAALSRIDAMVERDEVDDGYDEDRFGPVRRPPRQRPPNLWVSIFEKEAADVKQETEEAKRKRLADAATYRELLARQEAIQQQKRLQDRETANAYAKAQADQTAQWRAAEKEKQRLQQQHVVEESKRTQQELRDKHEQQMEAMRTKERNELRVVARYQAQMEDEKERREAAKEAHKAEMALVKEANAKQLEVKREVARKEQDEERALQREYEKKLEQQELARQEELAAILAKQSQKVKLALLNVKSAEEKAREDEARAMAIQQQVREKEARELERRERLKREGVALQVQALARQRQERVEKRFVDQQEEDAYAGSCKRELQSWQQSELDKKLARRQRERGHQQLIRQQMSADERRRANEDKYGMSRAEMALNALLLRHAGLHPPPADPTSR